MWICWIEVPSIRDTQDTIFTGWEGWRQSMINMKMSFGAFDKKLLETTCQEKQQIIEINFVHDNILSKDGLFVSTSALCKNLF